MSLRTLRNYKGFTLLEVLISVALISFIMVLIYQTTFQTIRGKQRVEKRDEVFHNARTTINKMVQDIEMAFLLDGKGHFGERQGSPQIKTVFNGRSEELYFSSLAHMRLFENLRESESSEIGYKLERDPDDSDYYLLRRRESAVVDNNPEDGGIWITLTEGIKKMEFEYYSEKRNDWQSSWNSVTDNKTLPRAVRVTLTFKHPSKEDEEFAFETIALIGMHKNAIDF